MVRIMFLNPAAHAEHPLEQRRAAVARVAPWLVCQLPGENRGLLFVKPSRYSVLALKNLSDVSLKSLADARITIEFVARFSSEPSHVLIHAAEIRPVVYKRENEAD